jgi:hypothetical protein
MPHPLRRSRKLALVQADIDNNVLDRNERVQSQTPRSTPNILLSSLLTPIHVSIYECLHWQVPLSEYFPEYTGGTDASEGAGCILARFLELNRLALPIYIL